MTVWKGEYGHICALFFSYMEILGYLASIFIGVSLGLIGGGGSILTVPVLVYLFRVDAVLATAYSLFIVGSTSVVGSFRYFQQGLVHVRTAIVFGIPSIVAVYLTRAFLLPAIPERIVQVGSWTLSKSVLLMLLFAVLMIAASYSMIKQPAKGSGLGQGAGDSMNFNYPLILLEGSVVGVLTGLVGAGGGFLIIPALVVLSNLPMKQAVGTSLVIIAAKSLLGLFGEKGLFLMDWGLLLRISGFAIGGIFIGMAMSRRIAGDRLKPAFGWFVLLMGFYIILKELVF